VVSSSSCERNWSSYSFVHSKARNRLLPSRAEDSVYVYTNSRVLNQNVPFIDKAATEWYMQTVVSKDSDSEGPTDLFDDYDDVSDFDTPNMSIDDEYPRAIKRTGRAATASSGNQRRWAGPPRVQD
jgi:hypothetical protein